MAQRRTASNGIVAERPHALGALCCWTMPSPATSPTSQRRSSRWHGMPAGCGTQRASYTPSPPPSAADLDRRPRPVRHRPCVPGRREPSDRVVDVTVPTSVWERGRATQRPWCHSTSACPGSHVTAPPSAVPTCRHMSAPVPPCRHSLPVGGPCRRAPQRAFPAAQDVIRRATAGGHQAGRSVGTEPALGWSSSNAWCDGVGTGKGAR